MECRKTSQKNKAVSESTSSRVHAKFTTARQCKPDRPHRTRPAHGPRAAATLSIQMLLLFFVLSFVLLIWSRFPCNLTTVKPTSLPLRRPQLSQDQHRQPAPRSPVAPPWAAALLAVSPLARPAALATSTGAPLLEMDLTCKGHGGNR